MELTAGTKIHGYTLVDFISNGATAEVWRIKDEFDNEKALKIFSPVQKVDEATLDLLIDEFKLLYKLDHPHILKSEIMGAYQKVPYIIMPFYNGNLAAEMTKRSHQTQTASPHFTPWYSEDECVTLMQQIGSGLAYLHEQGIIHQDVKPENILFNTFSEQVHYVLTDFGISTKIKDNIARMTIPRDQAYALTPAYASPEQFNGRREFKSDVFSMGVLLFEMCEGRLPFTKQGYVSDAYGNPPRAEFRNPALSNTFKAIINDALAESPEQRPAAKDFEQYAIRSRGNTITETEVSSIRTDKITVKQPMISQVQETNYQDPGIQDRLIKETISSPARKSKHKGGLIILLIVLGILLGASIFGFSKHSQTREKNMFSKARVSFENGNIHEANALYSTLAKKKSKEEYYARQFLTARIIAENYEEILRFKNDRAPVKKNGKWGFIDSGGKEVIKCIYTRVEEFNRKTTVVCKSATECGIINLKGEEQTPFIYSGIQNGGEDQWVLIRMENGKRISLNYHY